ncbi:Dinitrogenase iron-molybdenum cofactor [Sporomusa ovata DSM 2662]|uniref:Dinitrogenase iron-molybdenum cofactor biosynthesis protein n=1 Tax=Sporomusa ovata TaxID=2378 RepID=A0A0U1KYB2_9FIRM|nr:NifB/NifX family molybdenum-iron cluster-binding protein [Sporomusa ovata]EQB28978.1 dinitrogenase iron-molybdenum cofactor biosynthesis protein [Sporomusa ovata DSM 2662]CQR72410.1 Dinitrogenase iron-molybdenum cofactor biosynthesis protein [Sporomusa ovata]
MKIAITAHGENRQSAVDSRFSLADYFVLYDEESNTWSSLALTNIQNPEHTQGSGIQSSQNLAKTGAKVLITGHVGPKAFKVLQAEQIALYSVGEMNSTVEEALAAFQSGKLSDLNAPNALDLKK